MAKQAAQEMNTEERGALASAVYGMADALDFAAKGIDAVGLVLPVIGDVTAAAVHLGAGVLRSGTALAGGDLDESNRLIAEAGGRAAFTAIPYVQAADMASSVFMDESLKEKFAKAAGKCLAGHDYAGPAINSPAAPGLN